MRVLCAIVLCSLLTGVGYGQAGNTTHIFPQVVDGAVGDGTRYISLLFITNVGTASANCTFSLFGLDAQRLQPSTIPVLPSGTWTVALTSGQSPLQTGYGRLVCTQPVTSTVMYGLIDTNGFTISWATVFSAATASYAHIPAILGTGLQYGIAIANDNTTAGTFSVFLTVNGETVGKQVTIPARSQYVKFLDEIVTIPSGLNLGTIEIISTTNHKFNVMGLAFDGRAFTTLVPTILP